MVHYPSPEKYVVSTMIYPKLIQGNKVRVTQNKELKHVLGRIMTAGQDLSLLTRKWQYTTRRFGHIATQLSVRATTAP
jgi:hypothetical protein